MATTSKSSSVYLVAGVKPWNRRVFDETIRQFPGQWHFISAPESLTVEAVAALAPRYVFFMHWSVKVPQDILAAHECVCFHMTDVPYGRGGSPLQNLIARGHRATKLTALRMTPEFDAGPVYGKEDLSLEGNAEEIYLRAAFLSAQMMAQIAFEEPEPVPQSGKPVIFKRRRPQESEIQEPKSLAALHDLVRMLDAEGYPKAFLRHNGFRYEFSRAALYDGRLVADVTITQDTEP